MPLQEQPPRVAANHNLIYEHEDRSHRTIDDFLDELYRNYKLRFFHHDDDESLSHDIIILSTQHSQNLIECISNIVLKIIQQIRHCCLNNRCSGNWSYLPAPLLALCIANSSDATEILMLSYLLANPTFRRDMFANRDEDGSDMEGAKYLASSIFLGMLIGGTVLGILSDSIGRRPALLIGMLTNAIAGTLSSIPFLTPSFVQLTFLRFIAGIGIGATVPPLFSLASEWSPKEIRGKCHNEYCCHYKSTLNLPVIVYIGRKRGDGCCQLLDGG